MGLTTKKRDLPEIQEGLQPPPSSMSTKDNAFHLRLPMPSLSPIAAAPHCCCCHWVVFLMTTTVRRSRWRRGPDANGANTMAGVGWLLGANLVTHHGVSQTLLLEFLVVFGSDTKSSMVLMVIFLFAGRQYFVDIWLRKYQQNIAAKYHHQFYQQNGP